MSSSEDEDDKFLYGSDSELALPSSKRSRDDEADAGASSNPDIVKRQKFDSPVEETPATARDDRSDEDIYSDSSDDDSDSDLEVIISLGPDPTRLDAKLLDSYSTAATSSSKDVIRVATDVSNTITKTSDERLITEGEANQGVTATTVKATESDGNVPKAMTGSIDLDKEGIFDSVGITTIDPEVLKEKPWRQPGANLSDYFNYGFNEFTWMEYLHRQEKLQQDYNPRRILMGLLSLQQQGKLNSANDTDSNLGNIIDNNNNVNNANMSNLNSNMGNSMSGTPNPPAPPMHPSFPPLPMFGSFPPFPMPGMMPPMNQQPNQNQNQNSK
ncbi:CRE_collapsed_G0031430.mRNA.1.CDS.1 [Saccharomyces cerevisiae]|nr:BDF_1d_G0030540.mRNA.1.CDS.1 [Saccharomyces cerevisiae]CAI4950030.1 CRE_HP_G0036300.mRNA.1.CDS.1 [Saccharomyces cerevisiae]CAI5069545.1 CRE_HP_G0116860.mRNA.1.CDS.1 [Saccharomyces cerevisiae]CAI5162221.1 CRE_HP_G0146700.mRNA.1.CDS.1 [Saccharomyces cerevisiae]CAI6606072.1 CRE_HP_G0036300.mRNA.1.CDS.1 [Saccharomyces cerevisiae]